MADSRSGSPGSPGRSGGPADQRRVLPVLVFVGLLVAVVSSLGAPLIPGIAARDHVSLGTAQWMLTVALLAGALSTPLLGRMADGSRQRRVVVSTLLVVLLGCVVAAVAPSFWVLVVGRALQGIGLGVLPVNMAIARRILSPAAAARAVATLSVSTAIGAGVGYPFTALVAQAFGIRAAFWCGGLVVALALVAVLMVLPIHSPAVPRPFDWWGASLLTVAVGGLVIVLSESGAWGYGSALTVGLLVGSLICAGLWARQELATSHPLVELRHLARRPVLTADVTGFLMSLAMYLVIPVLVEFVQIPPSAGFGFGAAVVLSGLVFVPLSVGTYLASRLLVPLEHRLGIRGLPPLGGSVFAFGTLYFCFDHRWLWQAFLTMALIGIGIGFTFAALPGLIVRSVPHHETGSATGLYQLLRNVGLSAGSALGAAILRAHTPVGSLFPDIAGFQVTMITAAVLCLIGSLLSWLLPRRSLVSSLSEPVGVASPVALDELMIEEARLEASGAMLVDDVPQEGEEGTTS